MSQLSELYAACPLKDPRTCIRLLSLQPADDINEPLHANLACREKIVLECRLLKHYSEEEWHLFDSDGSELQYKATGTACPWRDDEGVARWKDSDCYEALSYHWGDASTSESILVNDVPVSVRSNLESALRHLRLNDRERVLWVDSLCINQQDDGEKTDQVFIMPKIYANANRTLIWLGDDSSHGVSEHTMKFINHAANFMRRQRRLSLRKRELSSSYCFVTQRSARSAPGGDSDITRCFENYKQTRTAEGSGGNASTVETLYRLLHSEWFSRRWVLQEVLAASRASVFCGVHNADWNDLMEILRTASGWPEPVEHLTAMKMTGRRRTKSHRSGMHPVISEKIDIPRNVFYALNYYDLFECSDPRDLIASMTRLSGTAMPWSSFRTDYSKSTEANFLAFATTLIELGYLAAVLQCAALRPRGHAEQGLPSWVPDWRFKLGSNLEEYLNQRDFSIYELDEILWDTKNLTSSKDDETHYWTTEDGAEEHDDRLAFSILGDRLVVDVLPDWEVKSKSMDQKSWSAELIPLMGCCTACATAAKDQGRPFRMRRPPIGDSLRAGDLVCRVTQTNERYILRRQYESGDVYRFIGVLGDNFEISSPERRSEHCCGGHSQLCVGRPYKGKERVIIV